MNIAEARAELIAALSAGGAPATDTPGGFDPPYCYVAGDGTGELTRIITGQVEASFRVTFVGGAWDDTAAAGDLDGLKAAFLETVRELEGWRFGSGIGRDGARDFAGATYLSADGFASRLVDI